MPQDRPSAPAPSHRIQSHSSPVNVVYISEDNERIYSADASGLVAITSTRTLRSLASWKAHEDALLGIQEWEDAIVTHGRDNKLHVWRSVREPRVALGDSAALPGLQMTSLLYSMDVNALNYCRFSLCPLPAAQRTEDRSALIALPNLVESSLADAWTLPSRQRLHAAIGKSEWSEQPAADGRAGSTRGMPFLHTHLWIIMSMHLFQSADAELRILMGYEDGSVSLSRYARKDKKTSVEGIGWEAIWTTKLHLESVMALAVTPDNTVALTASADHIIGRYDLLVKTPGTELATACVAHKTKSVGHSTITIRDDGKVCAVGGWDGKIRLYSVKTLKPLGALTLHKGACQALAFAHTTSSDAIPEEGDGEDITEEEKATRSRWLVSGGRDSRVAVWPLMSFTRT
ncbi:WD-40 repeat-containing protein [Heliocybe sulcata]|uniref:ASTRA-associated protein 1 n=1 Tax=Heliocybe sulcata TaxID=5364 RepID=A0A5C3MXF0_9AGAM|nr:WD-40 repeat-containing protein [Heliocybe sulcata]